MVAAKQSHTPPAPGPHARRHALSYITLDKACGSGSMCCEAVVHHLAQKIGFKGTRRVACGFHGFNRNPPSSAFKHAGGIRQDLQSKLDRTASRLVIENCAPDCGFLPFRVMFGARTRRERPAYLKRAVTGQALST